MYASLGKTAESAAYHLDKADTKRGCNRNNRFWERVERKVNATRAANGLPPLSAEEWEEVESQIAEARTEGRPWKGFVAAACAGTVAAVLLAVVLVGRVSLDRISKPEQAAGGAGERP